MDTSLTFMKAMRQLTSISGHFNLFWIHTAFSLHCCFMNTRQNFEGGTETDEIYIIIQSTSDF